MARSPDFGSYLINSRFLRLAFTMPTFTNLSSLTKYTLRPIMQKVQCHNHLSILSQFATTGNCYICLSVSGFSVFQHLPLASFHLSLTVLVHYRLFRVLRLGKWSYLLFMSII